MEYNIRTSYGHGNIQALQIIKEINGLELKNEDNLIFNFKNYSENNPFSNLVIANTLRSLHGRYEDEVNMSLIPNEESYLSHLGFYAMIGARYGKELGYAKPSDNYVPISKIQFEDDFYSHIEKKGRDLSALLKFDAGLQSCLQYVFIETIRNVYEHADINEVYVSAQKWLSKNLLEIAIADAGCGISKSLGRCVARRSKRK